MADLMVLIRRMLGREVELTDAATVQMTLRRQRQQGRLVRQLDREVKVLTDRLDDHIESHNA